MSGSSAAAPQSNFRAQPLSNLSLRLLVALVGIPLLGVAIWLGGPWYAGVVAGAGMLAAWEYTRLAAAGQGDPCPSLIYGSVALLLLDAWLGLQALAPVLTVSIFLALAWGALRYQQRGVGTGWLWTLGGSLYVGWLLGHFLSLRALEQGASWVFLAVSATFLNDTAAYAVGRLTGRHRMAPAISPGKTWEGAAGGLVATALGAPLLAAALGLPPDGSLWALGCGISLVAQTGDLVESMLKRTAGVKDASGLLPGHGGLLDRMDSLVFVGPLVYYYSLWVVRAT
ncbi:MAG: phosphatidate cytidylyltransferase [Chloroflexi bacterium]|nr:phosphatidate cytidylyltransferase [Chloroflexota bacterium]